MPSRPESCDIASKNIRVALTSACNFDCDYCDGPESRTEDKPGAMEDFRKKPLSEGSVNSESYIRIFRSLRKAGFGGINFTGGEPMMNPEWDQLVEEARRIGFERVEMTTNGTLLVPYLREHGRFPDELTLLKVSLDTHDPQKFREITKYGSLEKIGQGVRRLKETNPDLILRANKVLMRSDLPDLQPYINYVQQLGMDGIIFLDLVLTEHNDPEERAFFEREYAYTSEAIEILKQLYGDQLGFEDNRYGFKVILPNGLFVVLKDGDGMTLRDDGCDECPMYCQEGLFTARVSTDGSISPCLDRHDRLDYIASMSIVDDELNSQTHKLFQRLVDAEPTHSFHEFLKKTGSHLRTSQLSTFQLAI